MASSETCRAGVISLKLNRRPADGGNDTPASPLTSGGLLVPGFDIDRDSKGNIRVGNFVPAESIFVDAA